MLEKRAEQLKTGRLIPLVNEEYGYEDHYPKGWGETASPPPALQKPDAGSPGRSTSPADTKPPANAPTHPTGGGWINGRGDDSMTLAQRLRPHPRVLHQHRLLETVARPRRLDPTLASPNSKPAPALAARSAPGRPRRHLPPQGGIVSLKPELLADGLRPLWISPRDAGVRVARAVKARTYRAPTADDWVLLLSTPCNCSFRDHDNEFEGQSLPRRGYSRADGLPGR
jgi:hypothetical protein